jgi:hypothetical protein
MEIKFYFVHVIMTLNSNFHFKWPAKTLLATSGTNKSFLNKIVNFQKFLEMFSRNPFKNILPAIYLSNTLYPQKLRSNPASQALRWTNHGNV